MDHLRVKSISINGKGRPIHQIPGAGLPPKRDVDRTAGKSDRESL
jgi:hypothetical protein